MADGKGVNDGRGLQQREKGNNLHHPELGSSGLDQQCRAEQ